MVGHNLVLKSSEESLANLHHLTWEGGFLELKTRASKNVMCPFSFLNIVQLYIDCNNAMASHEPLLIQNRLEHFTQHLQNRKSLNKSMSRLPTSNGENNT